MSKNTFADVWAGFTVGGANASFILGGSGTACALWSLSGKRDRLDALIVGARVGAMAQAHLDAPSLVFMRGVRDFEHFKSLSLSDGGYDWQASLGTEWISKKKVEMAAGLTTLMPKLRPIIGAYLKNQENIEQIAGSNEFKTAFNILVGESENILDKDYLKNRDPQKYYIFPCLPSLGAGVGFWYEKTKLIPFGTQNAWYYAKPKWRLTPSSGNELILQIEGIPEPDGTDFNVAIRIDEWGYDPRIRFKQEEVKFSGSNPKDPRNITKKDRTGELLPATVQLGRMKASSRTTAAMIPSRQGRTIGFGLVLTNSQTAGVYEQGYAIGGSVAKRDLDYKTIKIGVDIIKGGYPVWQSREYVKVSTDTHGEIAGLAIDKSDLKGKWDWRE